MDIAVKKIELIEWLTKVDDESLIRKLDKIRSSTSLPLQPMAMEELEARIKRSEEDIKAGRVHTHQQVVEHFKKKSKS